MANTKPPVSQPVDHARWADERQRQIEDALRGDNGRIRLKIPHPIWDNKWVLLLAGFAWSLLAWQGKAVLDAQKEMSAEQAKQRDAITQIGANQQVVNIRLDVHDKRLDRLEQGR